jgi:hypothetical protein
MHSFFKRVGLVPGCYDDPDFLKLEETNPGALEHYGEYVLLQQNNREPIQGIAEALATDARLSEIQFRCRQVSLTLMNMLEAAGIWCFTVKGSVRFEFADKAHRPKSIWAKDFVAEEHEAGHFWVVAPPFEIVDVTARAQGWDGRRRAKIPNVVFGDSSNTSTVSYDPTLLVSPDVQLADPSFAAQVLPTHEPLWDKFPPKCVSLEELNIIYQPSGVIAPSDSLEASPLRIGGVRAHKWFKRQKITPLGKDD